MILDNRSWTLRAAYLASPEESQWLNATVYELCLDAVECPTSGTPAGNELVKPTRRKATVKELEDAQGEAARYRARVEEQSVVLKAREAEIDRLTRELNETRRELAQATVRITELESLLNKGNLAQV